MKNKLLKGAFWSAFERFSVQGISFLVQLLLARILLPEDYGLVGMLVVFLTISQSFIDSGFSTALIQRKNAGDHDFSTVFYFNVIIGIFVYVILFFSAPAIAQFYKQPLLVDILRISGLTLVINSFSVIQRTLLTIRIDFKTQSKASFVSAVVSGMTALYLAYSGFGVWSLVANSLLSSVLNTFLLAYYSRWIPLWYFSFSRLRSLFRFGSNILISGLVYTVYNQLYVLIIGRRFNAHDLGCYTRADQFYLFPSSNVCEILKRVYFPALCQIQDDKERLLVAYRKSLQLFSFIVFPLMMCLAALSEPLIRIVLTDKWLDVVWMLQLLCFRGMLFPLTTLNLNILNVIGRSDVFLKIQFITHLIAISAVCLLAFWANITMLILCQIAIVYIMLFIGTHYVKKHFGYGFLALVKDIKGVYILSILVGAGVYYLIGFFSFPFTQLLVGGLGYMALFFCMSWLFNVCNIHDLKKQYLK